MQSHTNEFVFKRKRKRLRINIQDTDTVLSFNQPSDELHSELIPEIVVLSEPATSAPEFPAPPSAVVSSENIVTVEKFLRCSVQTVPKTKQVVPGSVTPKRSRAYIRQRPAERRATSVQKVLKVPKRLRGSSRIAKTLFRAAVLTDVDPLDTLVDGAEISVSRRPLKFVPFNKFAGPSEPGKTRSVEPSDLGRGEDAVLHTRRLGDTSGLKARHHYPSSFHPRTPLYLVPLREAEAAYSAMFP